MATCSSGLREANYGNIPTLNPPGGNRTADLAERRHDDIVGGVLIYLAIAKDYEPVLLLPIGFGAILTNLPLTGITEDEGLFGVLYDVGIKTELFPLLHLHRHRGDDRFRPAAGEPQNGAPGRGRRSSGSSAR